MTLYFKRIHLLGLVFFCVLGLSFTQQVSAERNSCYMNWNLFTCQPANFSPPGKTAAEIAAERAIFLSNAARRSINARPTAFVPISKSMKNPNSVRIPLAQAPEISMKTDQLNGRRVCEHRNDKGNKSKQSGKRVHIDRECCLDPDEIPNPRCYYPKLGF